LNTSESVESGSEAGFVQESLEELYDDAPCGYLSLLPDGLVIKINKTFLTWTGHSREELIGRRFQDVLHIASKIYYETHFAPLLRMQGFFNEVALDFVRADGVRLPVLVNAVERREERGSARFIRMTVFNATDRRRYERELLEAKKTAEHAIAQLHELNSTLEQRVAEEVQERTKAEEALRQAQKMEANRTAHGRGSARLQQPAHRYHRGAGDDRAAAGWRV
jgi:PAS domain S-box-containing protein